jgi:hypothetical protein
MGIFLTTAISGAFLLTSTTAQDAATIEGQLVTCRDMADTAQRLDCYDAVAAGIDSAAIQQAEVSQKEAKAEKRRLFGFRAPKPVTKEKDFGKREKPEEITQISAAITEVKFRRDIAHRITLDNGQVWEQLGSDNRRVYISKKKDYTATIKSGALGSFKMTIEPAGRTINVRRIK